MPDMTYSGWFTARARREPQRAALTFEGRTWTYGELCDEVDRLAQGLRERGVRQADRIAYVGENHAALLMTLIAAGRIGAIILPVNFRLAEEELAFILADSGAVAVVADPPRAQLLDSVFAAGHEGVAVRVRLVVDQPCAGWEEFTEVVGGSAPIDAPALVRNDDPALLMYTSGTTGSPKGAVLTHANLWWNDESLFGIFHVTAQDTTLAVAPLFHIAGLNVTVGMTWKRGGRVVVMRRFTPAAFLSTIETERVNTLLAVPAMFLSTMRAPEFAEADLSSLRVCLCGGAPVPPQVVTTLGERGVTVVPAYGLTECAPCVMVLAPDAAATHPSSVGKVPMYMDVKLMHEGVEQTGPEAEGEIWVRGGNITVGYWNNPVATAAAIDEAGWFRTGDVGRRDAAGFHYVVDRIKDVVITGGENVYPAELEHHLLDHPAVVEVAVIGTADDVWGEAVTAVVVPADGEERVGVDDFRSVLEGKVARFKWPRRIEFVNELPRNAQGKVLKTVLRDRFSEK